MKRKALFTIFLLMLSTQVLAEMTYDESKVPSTPLGDAIKYGRKIIDNTYDTLPHNVGNQLNCSSCHQEGGTKLGAIPFFGLPSIYPMYSKRDKTIISLQNRINECFQRSENGHPLALDSKEMKSILAYMVYISKDMSAGETKDIGLTKLKPVNATSNAGNSVRGKNIYETKCAMCHQAGGEGISGVFPPVWGNMSFNDGAGMSKPEKAALYIYANMPKSAPGTLTWQEAKDVAQYMDTQPRPHFILWQHN